VTEIGVGLWAMQSSATRPAPYPALYRDLVDAAVLADELDFHAIWLAEHRLWYDGYCPALLHAQAAVAARTSQIRLGQAMLVAPQHDAHGLAANARTLNELSAGRLEFGLGLGHRDTEFDALGLRRDRRGRMFEEMLDELETVGARIWLGGMATPTLDRAARRGHSLMLPQTLYTRELEPLLDEYRSLGGTGTIGIMRDTWIESDPASADRARARIHAHYLEEAGAWWVLKGTVGFQNPEQLERQLGRMDRASLIGHPDAIAEQLRADIAAGVEVFALRLSYDFTSPAELAEQLHRLAEQVVPLLGDVS
jgi:alkanesulfonate monooxygenase SsuD/methylene tetrahydromethanopterin reductase-like flavin-dependent oxidoreductase (luciferase family)